MIQMVQTGKQKIVQANAPKPVPKPGEVLLRPIKSGICGSDIHAYYGEHPFMTTPIVLGHEFFAVIESIGEEGKNFSAGDRVTAMPQLYCNECKNCRDGRYNICDSLKVIGCQVAGSMQEFFCVPERLVLKLPDTITPEEGAMLEPLAVGVHACKRAGVSGKRVLVQGAGTIGILTAQAALALGAAEAAVSDYNRNRLSLAKDCGVNHAVDLNETSTSDALQNLWGDERADLIIECVGAQGTITEAVKAARKGSDIVVAGVFPANISVDMGLVQDKEL
ncbi:MAG: alcohol dehydrogenase catalytic domain-containing protein, partial [Defluviitaleaceae bacterium]|nr:alcohol dehydrogenase catalytic domain-containing protein [Defluviitaleaceae bacterium]